MWSNQNSQTLLEEGWGGDVNGTATEKCLAFLTKLNIHFGPKTLLLEMYLSEIKTYF